MYKCALLTFCILSFTLNAQAQVTSGLCEDAEIMLDIRDVKPDGQGNSNLSNLGLYTHAVPAYDGKLHFTLTGLPRFEDYPAEKSAPSTIAQSIDWESDSNSKKFRTKLTEGLNRIRSHIPRDLIGGKYAAISLGCGSGGCQLSWIINVETGKVLGNIDTNQGLLYRHDSRLLIANLYPDQSDSTLMPKVDEYYNHRPVVGYYEIKDNELSFFKLVCTPSPWELKEKKYKNSLEVNVKKEITNELKKTTIEEIDAQIVASIEAQNKQAAINLTGGTTIEEQRQTEAVAEDMPMGDLISQGFDSFNAAVGIKHMLEQRTIPSDPNFKLEESWDDITKDVPGEYRSEFLYVHSKAEADFLKKRILSDLESKAILDAAGYRGQIATIAPYIPILLFALYILVWITRGIYKILSRCIAKLVHEAKGKSQ